MDGMPSDSPALLNLTPMQQLRAGRLSRRVTQLVLGLMVFGASIALVLRSGLGMAPWDVLHVGLAQHVPLTIGTVTILVGVVVLLLWIPLRQWPGLGTVLNIFLVGLALTSPCSCCPIPWGAWDGASSHCWQGWCSTASPVPSTSAANWGPDLAMA